MRRWDGTRWTDDLSKPTWVKEPGLDPVPAAQSNRFAVASFLLLAMAIAYEVLVLDEVIGLGPWWLILSIGAVISAAAAFRSPEEGAWLGKAVATAVLAFGIVNIVIFGSFCLLAIALSRMLGGA